jgi:hypothetical protein
MKSFKIHMGIFINSMTQNVAHAEWVEENIPKEGGTSIGTLKQHRPAENGRTAPTLADAGIGHHESP